MASVQEVEVHVENGKETADKNSSVSTDDFVDPWNVVSSSATGVDYDKLICE